MRRPVAGWGILCVALAFFPLRPAAAESVDTAVSAERPPKVAHIGDPVLYWNSVALAAVAGDYSSTSDPPAQGGPGRGARALAIVHAAVYDAVNSITRRYTPYLTLVPLDRGTRISLDAAVAEAGYDTLTALFPAQRSQFDAALAKHLKQLPTDATTAKGRALGHTVAVALLEHRSDDGADFNPPHQWSDEPGHHRPDPLNPSQGYLGGKWGLVRPFVIETGDQFRAAPPPPLDSLRYAAAFAEVKHFGGDGVGTPTLRTQEQTNIGLFWGYDGDYRIGTVPRLFNQIVRTIAVQMGNDVVENARLFALVNLAMADASIACWESKYHYDLWRPILGIRESDEGTGPTGKGDGNPLTRGDPEWTPLGALASNGVGTVSTPNFPAYPSGHASFAGAVFYVLARFYRTDALSFTFTSDEMNGITTDWQGVLRPLAPRTFYRLSEAARECAQSRIYLGVHWQFDATAGLKMGRSIGSYVFENALQPAG